ncbi:hypothetical protein B0H13DRAFT_1885371 [Mycena leptocephala]|nr:hypothetical protein B0H13DRAFT_1885371 [Mycena leptocephala]
MTHYDSLLFLTGTFLTLCFLVTLCDDVTMEPESPPTRKKVYLVLGVNVKKPGGYLSWPSADAQYKSVSAATIKGYSTWELLRGAWHARCDAVGCHHWHQLHALLGYQINLPRAVHQMQRFHKQVTFNGLRTTAMTSLKTWIRWGLLHQAEARVQLAPLHCTMDKPPKKHKHSVYTYPRSTAKSVTATATNRRVQEEYRPAPLPSPEKWKYDDNFDHLMGLDYANEPAIIAEGPAAIKIKKAKRYENLDHPIKSWIPTRDDCLDGLMTLVVHVMRDPEASRQAVAFVAVWEWEDGFFHPRTTRDLGIQYQLSHYNGQACEWVQLSRPIKDFVVLHNNGIHTIDIDFCSCPNAPSEVDQLLDIGWYLATSKEPSTAASLSLLRRFHKLNLQGHLPVYDFYNTLVLLTNTAGLQKLPNCLPQFMHMVHEYRHLQMCKRAGHAHHPEGISATQLGELAIPCRACPHLGINPPEGWEDAPPEIAYVVSGDANFKMKGCNCSSRDKDPTLGPGWAYMVANDQYLEHLVKYVNEDKHCGLQIIRGQRDYKHRGSGMGDLQKGESNMDYLFFSSLIGITVKMIVASYDIACQWSHKFYTRATVMPAHMQLPLDTNVIFKVPKFHLPPHVKECHGPHSFNYTKGVGRTNGEGVERNLSWLNWAARSVSVMGPGAREDTIDDLCGFSNWKKTVDLGNSLLRKMALAIPQAMVHSCTFHVFTEGLRDGHEEDLLKWEKMVHAWEVDQSQDNPYEYAEVEETMADVMKRISKEDHVRVMNSGAAGLEVSPVAFLLAGIEIEELQEAVTLEAKQRNRTTIQATTLQWQQTLLLGKIMKLQDVQGQYMPGLRQWIALQNPPFADDNNAKPKTIKVYLPSSLPTVMHETVCAAGLAAQEDCLRNAQAADVLRDLQSGLHTRTFAHRSKRKHISGQGMYTKSQTLIDAIEDNMRDVSSRYQVARAALLALRGPGEWERVLQVLRKEDARGMNERVMNEEEKEENRKARVLAGLPADGQDDELDEYREPVDLTVLLNLETGEGKRLLSWIWYTQTAGNQNTDGSLHADLQVEWVKARVWADRWREELLFVDEEMGRVFLFGDWKAQWWEARLEPTRVPRHREISAELAEDLHAYALEQVSRERDWVAAWMGKWKAVCAHCTTILRDQLVNVTEEVFVPIEAELEEEDGQDAFEDDGFEEEQEDI